MNARSSKIVGHQTRKGLKESAVVDVLCKGKLLGIALERTSTTAVNIIG